jgi:hypothetical protein
MQAVKVFSRCWLAALGVIAISVAAQPPGPPGGPAMMDIDRLAVLLDLDAYQKQEVARILDEEREARAAQRKAFEASGQRPSFDEIEARRAAMREELLTKLQGVLTAPQIEKFKLLTERPPGRREGFPPQ